MVRGSLWTFIGFGAGNLLRLLNSMVMTRMLRDPAAFGLIGLAGVVWQALSMFSDMGIREGVIQHKRDDRVFLDTAWTIHVLRGLMLWICTGALAWPVSHFYSNFPLLVYVLPVMGLGGVIQGLNSINVYTLNRNLEVARLTLLDLGSHIVSIVVMIVWAWFSPTPWALVAGGLVQNSVYLYGSHFLLPGQRCRFRWDPVARRELFNFGKWIFGSTVLTFFAGQTDRLVYGKLITPDELGLYGIAMTLALLPTQIVVQIGSVVAFPLYSRLRNEGGDLNAGFHRVRMPLVVLAGAMCAGLGAGGAGLVQVIYPTQFHDAGPILQILAVGSWFLLLECLNGAALLALGQAKWVMAGGFGKLVGMAVGIPLGYWLHGFEGAVGGVAVAEACKYSVSVFAARRYGLRVLPKDLVATAIVAIAAVAGLAIGGKLRFAGLGPYGEMAGAALAVLLTGGTVLAASPRLRRNLMRELRGL